MYEDLQGTEKTETSLGRYGFALISWMELPKPPLFDYKHVGRIHLFLPLFLLITDSESYRCQNCSIISLCDIKLGHNVL